jgi:hypothetical protein
MPAIPPPSVISSDPDELLADQGANRSLGHSSSGRSSAASHSPLSSAQGWRSCDSESALIGSGAHVSGICRRAWGGLEEYADNVAVPGGVELNLQLCLDAGT